MSKINPLGPVWIPGLLLDLFKSEKKDNPKTKDTNKKTSADAFQMHFCRKMQDAGGNNAFFCKTCH